MKQMSESKNVLTFCMIQLEYFCKSGEKRGEREREREKENKRIREKERAKNKTG